MLQSSSFVFTESDAPIWNRLRIKLTYAFMAPLRMTEYFRFGAVRIVVCFVVVVGVLLLSCFIFRLLSGIYAARLCISRYFAIFRLLFCLVFFADFFYVPLYFSLT